MASEDKKETVAETKEVKEETTPTENSKSETKDKDIDTSAPPAEPAPPKPTVKKVNYEKDVVYLYQFPRTSVIPSISPYCLKVETWLRLAGLKYEDFFKLSVPKMFTPASHYLGTSEIPNFVRWVSRELNWHCKFREGISEEILTSKF
ncbi:unnamed protein product [Bemisia tabaci]|uniref:Thioredoxin-like fold domain-containing protein n=1 Tax=Bemisia tabaci TaxID=7038 RepID=A0A9P0A7T7_BEMTA|nr:unnamed protein product [Bemisia tabaci]